MNLDFNKIKTITSIQLEPVLAPWSQHETTDFRRKVLRVRFADGSIWVPKNTEIEELLKLSKEAFRWNILFADPDKHEF